MNPLDWFMVAVGLYGAIFFAIGVASALGPRVQSWREKRRGTRAAMWRSK